MTNITISVDEEVREVVSEYFATHGLDLATAINEYLKKVYRTQQHSGKIDPKVRFGGWEDKIVVPDNFNEPIEDFEDYE